MIELKNFYKAQKNYQILQTNCTSKGTNKNATNQGKQMFQPLQMVN